MNLFSLFFRTVHASTLLCYHLVLSFRCCTVIQMLCLLLIHALFSSAFICSFEQFRPYKLNSQTFTLEQRTFVCCITNK